jgi:hypothetical protein
MKNDENNYSFLFQSCSIVFLKIIDFPLWCKENNFIQCISLLNLFYQHLDKLLLQFPRLTKIKYMSECCMVAGGIISGQN